MAQDRHRLPRGTRRVQLVERAVRAEEVGRGLDRLASGGVGLRVYRGGAVLNSWDMADDTLRAGDTIVEIVPTSGSAPQ